MDIFVINDKGALDIKDVPMEDDFDKFWNEVEPYFKGLDDECYYESAAYVAAKITWKQAIMSNRSKS